MRIRLLLGIFLIFSIQSLFAHHKDSVAKDERPYFVQAQFAGNLGLISGGIGKYMLDEKIKMALLYGYLPYSVSGVEVHTLAIKASANVLDCTYKEKFGTQFYIESMLLYGMTKNTYIDFPNYYPKDYYSPNAFHFSLSIGENFSFPVKHERIDKWSFYVELGTIDSYLWYAISSKEVDLDDIWNLCFGVSFDIK